MHILPKALVFALIASTSAAQCGGDFRGFVQGLAREAVARGHNPNVVQTFFEGAAQDPKVLEADRSQGHFQKDFLRFSNALISDYRKIHGARNAATHAQTFRTIQRRYGIPPGVLLAFWAFETDYGLVQGNFNTRNALVTLAHDCRRPELFRPQVFAAIALFARGGMDPARTTGAWAGEIGMIQMLPKDIIENGVDGDGDGRVDLQTSTPDALMTGARMLAQMGWRAGQPWLQEVVVPQTLDWAQTGLDKTLPVSDWAARGVKARNGALFGDAQASILLPMGRNGPAFIAYPNFHVYFEWNKSLVYVTTAAYFATLLEGGPAYDPRTPDTGLNGAQMLELQRRLAARGYDVGKLDGILGAKTRAAVQAEQGRLGLPADAWPTPDLLGRL